MKERLTHWPSTVPALGLLAFLAFVAWLRPELLSEPDKVILLAAGLAALLIKGNK